VPEPIQIRTKPEQIADYYQRLINSGEIMPGHKLPSASQIAKQFGVGRNTALGVFKELDRRQLVTVVQCSGAYAKIAA
jgi:DNA-binding FadR family transcriptional regulator